MSIKQQTKKNDSKKHNVCYDKQLTVPGFEVVENRWFQDFSWETNQDHTLFNWENVTQYFQSNADDPKEIKTVPVHLDGYIGERDLFPVHELQNVINEGVKIMEECYMILHDKKYTEIEKDLITQGMLEKTKYVSRICRANDLFNPPWNVITRTKFLNRQIEEMKEHHYDEHMNEYSLATQFNPGSKALELLDMYAQRHPANIDVAKFLLNNQHLIPAAWKMNFATLLPLQKNPQKRTQKVLIIPFFGTILKKNNDDGESNWSPYNFYVPVITLYSSNDHSSKEAPRFVLEYRSLIQMCKYEYWQEDWSAYYNSQPRIVRKIITPLFKKTKQK